MKKRLTITKHMVNSFIQKEKNIIFEKQNAVDKAAREQLYLDSVPVGLRIMYENLCKAVEDYEKALQDYYQDEKFKLRIFTPKPTSIALRTFEAELFSRNFITQEEFSKLTECVHAMKPNDAVGFLHSLGYDTTWFEDAKETTIETDIIIATPKKEV